MEPNKNTYYSVSLPTQENSKLILDSLQDLMDFIENIDEDETYLISKIKITQDVFDSLKEWDGF